MRIIGTIDHPILKITIFQMDNRILVKFESGLYEQTYKFRTGEAVETVADVEKWIDEALLEEIQTSFQQMHAQRNQAVVRNFPSSGTDEFEEII